MERVKREGFASYRFSTRIAHIWGRDERDSADRDDSAAVAMLDAGYERGRAANADLTRGRER